MQTQDPNREDSPPEGISKHMIMHLAGQETNPSRSIWIFATGSQMFLLLLVLAYARTIVSSADFAANCNQFSVSVASR